MFEPAGCNIQPLTKVKVYEKMHEHRTNLKWMINRSFRLGVLGHYIDKKEYGKLNGLFVNYFKSIYYLLKFMYYYLFINNITYKSF